MKISVYLSGEIHSDWRDEITKGIEENNLPIEVLTPVTDHPASDNVGTDILGREDSNFWRDHKSAKINLMRIKTGINKSDIVIVKFGERYRQWNAAFDAGYAVGMGKRLIVIHPEEHIHALKEIDGNAAAVARTEKEVLEILKYITLQK